MCVCEWQQVLHPGLFCLPILLQSKAHGVQKKAYRVLEEVCASEQGPGALFVQNHLSDLKQTLLDSLRSTSSPAKRVSPGQRLSAKEDRAAWIGCRVGGMEGPDCRLHSPV